MRAQQLIGKASFGPVALKAIYQAYDDAWSEIASDYDDDAQAEAGRIKLAKVLLSLANDDSTDPATLTRLALGSMTAQD